MPDVHTAGSRLVLGRFSAGSRRVFGGLLANWFRGSFCGFWKVLAPNFLPEGPRRSPGNRPEAFKRLPKAPKSSPRVARRPPGVSKIALKTRFCFQWFSGAPPGSRSTLFQCLFGSILAPFWVPFRCFFVVFFGFVFGSISIAFGNIPAPGLGGKVFFRSVYIPEQIPNNFPTNSAGIPHDVPSRSLGFPWSSPPCLTLF